MILYFNIFSYFTISNETLGECEEYGGLVNPLDPTKCCSKHCKGYCSDLAMMAVLIDGPGICYDSPDRPASDCCGLFIPLSKVCGVANQSAPCTRGILTASNSLALLINLRIITK